MNFQDAMNEVLETSRYDFLTGRRIDIRERLSKIIFDVFEWINENLNINMPSGTNGGTSLIAIIFTVVAVIIIATAAYVMTRAFLRSRIATRHTLHDIFHEIKNHTVAELLELSRKAADQRTAVRYKYIAAILSLNERDIIVIDPSATNAIILRQIRNSDSPQLSAPFAQIVEAFHLSWFGHKDLNESICEKLNSAVEKVVGHA
jgi:hypothetical protein